MDFTAAALEFNRSEPEFTPEYAEMIKAGTPVVKVTTAAPGLGHVVRVVAYAAVRLADGSLAAASDVVMTKYDRRRTRMTHEKAAAWWARKNFGAAPVEHTHSAR